MAPPLRNLKLLDLSRQLMIREAGGLKLIASPLKLSDTPPADPTPPPEFGQHTDEVLRRLGDSASAIEGLRANRIV
jgi:crotonobetainyl-CoA:carnitine CoA-transferase CaiB-like acyl-CoA transferase